jgi:hypothetical protein
MNVFSDILVLINEIEKGLMVYFRIFDFYKDFTKNKFNRKLKKIEDAIVISEVFCNSYTCLETIFLRISQHFENNLQSNRWHQNLLQNMTIRVDDIRERVLSEETYNVLLEFLKFRHFKRYYFEFSYDWDKLDFLQKKYKKLLPLIKKDITAFVAFLRKLADNTNH